MNRVCKTYCMLELHGTRASEKAQTLLSSTALCKKQNTTRSAETQSDQLLPNLLNAALEQPFLMIYLYFGIQHQRWQITPSFTSFFGNKWNRKLGEINIFMPVPFQRLLHQHSVCHKEQKSYRTFFLLLPNCIESVAGDFPAYKGMAHFITFEHLPKNGTWGEF